jgi:pimeloyl-ACP methyl ester carboxylesterase
MADQNWTSETVPLPSGPLHVARSGSGTPLLLLHHDIGSLDRLPFYDALAQRFTVIRPSHPGYDKSERPAWMRSVRDIAIVYQALMAEFGLRDVTLVGLGFGGWIAAEMAAMAPKAVSRLILVGPFGIKPKEGEILDQAIVSYIDYPTAAFHAPGGFEKIYGDVSTDQLEAWDIAREMSFRIAWKPYMYSQTLPHLLGSVKAPSLIVWGENDRHIPASAAAQWKQALPNAKVEIVKSCGHAVDLEKPAELAKLIAGFVK